MKKIAIFLFIIIAIITGISYMYLNYRANLNIAQNVNKQFESYYEKEIYGAELTTIINKAVDSNIANEVEEDNKGKYINNNDNSINIDIKMLDVDRVFDMETLYNGGMNNFVQYYSGIVFKCTKIEHHDKTGRIKYMLFEQITE